MKVYQLADPEQLRLRAHPWTHAEADPRHRYLDFRKRPDLIRSSLEDLTPWDGHPFTETFYRLLEGVNGPDSLLESNDCAFAGPHPNEGPHSERRLEASGRVMILFRDLTLNTSEAHVGELTQRIAHALSERPEDFEAVVGVSIVAVQFTGLSGPPARQRGRQLMLSFWAWGDDEGSTLDAVNRALGDLEHALQVAGGL